MIRAGSDEEDGKEESKSAPHYEMVLTKTYLGAYR
jgi:hypothetical protein